MYKEMKRTFESHKIGDSSESEHQAKRKKVAVIYMRSGEPRAAGFWTEGSQSSQDENQPGPSEISGTAKQSGEKSDS